ncbi:unnamed protein product [Plutella xylostella]|uniref:UDP-glucuronosyltransferase n=1 Tax=Plutella xylostella TaxID=51655 RepID=A0A8S4G4X8_PLUXY|nr:unnamed protein product [Plutella xylostella]
MILKSLSAVLFLLCFCTAVQGAHILALFSSLSFSDHYVFRSYVGLLALRGHNVVVMTPYPGQFQFPEKERIVELDVGESSAPYWEEYKKLVTNTDDYHKKLRQLNEFSVKVAISQLKSKQMTALFINPNVKFDLVITEADVPLLYAVAEKYKAPHIAFTTGYGTIPMYEAKGAPTHPLYYPDVNTLNFRDLSFWQQWTEISRYLQSKREYHSNYLPLCQVAAEKILGIKRDLEDIEKDIDLLFVSANPALTGNRPSVPAIAYVDRLQIKPGMILPPNLLGVLNAAEKGAIFFSLGTIQESEQLTPSKLQTLADAFKELPYLVLWKIGNTTMFNKPDNVMAQAWFPQQEILAHPNVKAFITHGGPRSLEEAVFFEKPIIGLPMIKSRKTFIKEITRLGAGEIVDPYTMDKETLVEKIGLVASDEKYKTAISLLKQNVQDPVVSGPDHAVWWTEYVLRHQGAKNLRSSARDAGFISYLLIDFMTYLVSVSLISIVVLFYALRFIIKMVKARLTGEPVLGKFKAL